MQGIDIWVFNETNNVFLSFSTGGLEILLTCHGTETQEGTKQIH